MNIIKITEKLAKKMKWYDFSLLKLSIMTSTLFLVTLWPAFARVVLNIEWYWYLIATIVLIVPLLEKMFSK